MFEWLEIEMSAIKTPKFHSVDGPADQDMREAVMRSELPVPQSYREFVLKFGSAKLYRDARNDSYRIGLFAAPRETTLDDGTRIYHLGFHEGASVYAKSKTSKAEPSIFEFETETEELVADNFEKWLISSCVCARKSYGKKKWAEIVRGPKPFTLIEEEIIKSRRQIHWRVIGIDATGDHIIEVTNAGSRTLPMLTLGVRTKDRRLNGAAFLQIGHIGPGQTSVLHADCYKNLVSPNNIEVFSLPEPRPEDRERYGEFTIKARGNQI
jgi:hypothetical protein